MIAEKEGSCGDGTCAGFRLGGASGAGGGTNCLRRTILLAWKAKQCECWSGRAMVSGIRRGRSGIAESPASPEAALAVRGGPSARTEWFVTLRHRAAAATRTDRGG